MRVNDRVRIKCQLKVKVKLLSHVRLCDPMDCSLPGSSVHGIFQARILEWVAISFSRTESILMRWIKLELIIQSEINQKEKQYTVY